MKRAFILVFVLFLLTLFVFNSQIVTVSAKNALNLCLTSVIPSLFPFFVLSSLLISSGASQLLSKPFSKISLTLFGTTEATTPLILSFLSGYPIGAKTVCELYTLKRCTKESANKLLLFCNNTGPAFIIGISGSLVLKSPTTGIILYVLHIVSAILVGIFANVMFPSKEFHKMSSPSSPPFSNALTQSIKDGILSCINISGFVIFFSILISLLSAFFGFLPLTENISLLNTLISGFLELTSGLYNVSSLSMSFYHKAELCSIFLAFGSISVLFQTASLVLPAGLSLRNCILGKVLHAFFNAILSSIVFRFWDFPITVSTFDVSGFGASNFIISDYNVYSNVILFLFGIFIVIAYFCEKSQYEN